MKPKCKCNCSGEKNKLECEGESQEPEIDPKPEIKQKSTPAENHCNFCKKCVEKIKCQLCNLKNSVCEIPYKPDNSPKLNRDL